MNDPEINKVGNWLCMLSWMVPCLIVGVAIGVRVAIAILRDET